MADSDGDSDEARALRPLQAAPGQWPGPLPGTNSPLDCLCPGSAYRIAFGPRAGQKVLTLQGTMPREKDFKQTLCADIDGFSAARCRALRGRRPPGAGTTLPHHHPARSGQRSRADQRRRTGGSQAQDPLARRDHASGHVAAGVHAAAGGAGATATSSPHSFGVRVTSLREVSGPPLREPRRSRPQRQAARTTARCGWAGPSCSSAYSRSTWSTARTAAAS